jgi:lipoate-protein ligase A
MRYLELTLPTPEENLALDEALLLAAEDNAGELLRIWEWPRPAVVLGSGGRLAEEVDCAACRADGVPILRRSSGGGTILLSNGCLLYSLILDAERTADLADIRRSYTHILQRVARSLATDVPDVEVRGVSDLTIGGRKFSGNAQQRKRRHILHHGSLLYAFDAASVTRYLPPPPKQPEYRAGRAHAEFLVNVPLSRASLIECLRREWDAEESARDWPVDEVTRLSAEKYANPAWTGRR